MYGKSESDRECVKFLLFVGLQQDSIHFFVAFDLTLKNNNLGDASPLILQSNTRTELTFVGGSKSSILSD